MPTNYDTLTRSESDSDDDERGSGPSAQALHGTVAHHAPIEHIVAPPEYGPPPPIVRLPLNEGRIFDRNDGEEDKPSNASVEKAEDDDSEEDDEDERQDRRARHATIPPVASVTQPTAPQPTAEHFVIPHEDDEENHGLEAAPPAPEVASQPTHDHAAEQQPTSFEQPYQPIAEQEANHQSAPEDESRASTSVPRPRPTPPATEPAAAPRSELPFHVRYEDMPPPPSIHSGGKPPLPPTNRPPETPGAGYPDNSGRNYDTGPAYTGGPAYNAYEHMAATPSAHRAEHQPQYDNNKAVDGFARLMGVGNFIGNHRTRKRLGKQIEQNRRETTANFADVQAQQLRMNQEQRRQAQALEQLRTTNERPAAPYTAEQPPVPATHAEYVPAPTYASQANPNTSSVRLTERGPMPPLPPIEQPRNGNAAPKPLEQSEQQPQFDPEQQQQAAAHEMRTIRSSWHEAVVDKHGKVVEGAKEYGRGFQQSRREVMHDRAGDATAAGVTALAGIQQRQGSGPLVQYPGSGTLPSGMTNPTLPQGSLSNADAQHRLPSRAKTGSKPGPVFWIMLAVIIAAFFAAAMI